MSTITQGRRPNRFCGPAAVALVAGISTDQAAAALRAVTGRRRILGVTADELVATLARLGYRCAEVMMPLPETPTLARWWKATGRVRPAGTLLLMLADHVALASGDRYADNHTGGFVPFSDARIGKRRRVYLTFAVMKVPGVKSSLLREVTRGQ